MKEYKNILLGKVPDFAAAEFRELQSALSAFPQEDVSVEISDAGINVRLRQIDFEFLRELAAKSESRLLRQFFGQLDSIKSYGIRGGKRLYAGYNAERKVKNRKSKEENRNIHFYADESAFSRENNKLPDEFCDQILCGDSTEVLRKLPENCVDLVFTSPPYNFGLDYSQSEDAHDWRKYFNQLFALLDQCVRVLKFGGRIIINVQPLFSDYIPSHHLISHHLMSRKLIWKGEILWQKNNYNCKYTAWGSWKSPASPYLKYTWEFLEIFCKGALKKDGKSADADITDEEFKKWVVAEWSIAPERKMKGYGHPAMFPEELARRAIKLFSFKGDIILDPFNGVGTTTVVARQLQRRYLGIDISEEYCQKASSRINKNGELPLFTTQENINKSNLTI